MEWNQIVESAPLVAILRGVEPEEVVGIGLALCDAGFRCIEIPLNSPRPMQSIRALRQAVGNRALIGAGTVLDAAAVGEVAAAGGQIVVSPNANPAVIAATKQRGLVSLPAFQTPTEAFAAIEAGADGLKLFPAEAAAPSALKAMSAVLPRAVPVFAVGGIDTGNMAPYLQAGATGFGLGSALYARGRTAAEVRARAEAFMRAWSELRPAA